MRTRQCTQKLGKKEMEGSNRWTRKLNFPTGQIRKWTNTTMSPKRLTVTERVANFCYHPKGGNSPAQWTVDPVTRRSVCCLCSKPSPEMGLRICAEEECGDEFIMPFDWKWTSKYYVTKSGAVFERTVFCPKCNGDETES